ncbi:hypothetical protein ACWEQ1_20760 [Streptomyces nodosus]
MPRSAADRGTGHLAAPLALHPRKRLREDIVLKVNGTPLPTRDHTVTEQPKNHRVRYVPGPAGEPPSRCAVEEETDK